MGGAGWVPGVLGFLQKERRGRFGVGFTLGTALVWVKSTWGWEKARQGGSILAKPSL